MSDKHTAIDIDLQEQRKEVQKNRRREALYNFPDYGLDNCIRLFKDAGMVPHVFDLLRYCHPLDAHKVLQLRYWTTKNGQELRPEEFRSGHLINTIKFLERRAAGLRQMFILQSLRLPEPNGDMAQLAWEQELDRSVI